MSKSIYNYWLPESLAERVATEEPQRYAALVAALKAQWERDRLTLPLAEAVRATQPFLAPCRTLYHARAELDPKSLMDLVRTQLSIVLLGEGDLMVQTRWALQAQQLLRTHRAKLHGLRVGWRPWVLMLRRAVVRDGARDYEGSALSEARRQTIARLIHRLRRHWPKGSASEIWSTLRPALLDLQRPAAFETLGWLVMLLPTTAARSGDGDWGAWAREWASLWGELPHCTYWDTLWGALFARLAAHDTFGLVDWKSLAPTLLSRYAWAFRVPVGSSFADPPLSFDCPRNCQVLFANELQSRAECAAHAAVYMIGHDNDEGVDTIIMSAESAAQPESTNLDPALHLLERLIAVLEQYYHPSNGGRWTSGLAHLLRALTGAFAGRLLSESRQRRRIMLKSNSASQGESNASNITPSRSTPSSRRPHGRLDDEAEKEEAAREVEDIEEDIGDVEEEDEEAVVSDDIGPEGSGSESSEEEETLPVPSGGQRRRRLSEATISRLASLLLRLADKAQFGKDRELRRGATRVLGQLAEIAPGTVLPAVHKHFCAALETVTSTHVLAGAIQSLTLCVRPMLLAGLHLENGIGLGDGGFEAMQDDQPAPRVAAGEALAAALVATLPAIDANDPAKSLAAFRFYAVTLSSLAGLPEHPTPGFPFDTEVWTEELLSRIFAAMSNLDSPEHHHASDGAAEGGAGGGNAAGNDGDETFLLDSASMFRPLVELLFSRLPRPLRRHAVQRVARFLLENTLTSVTAEATVLCNAIVWADAPLALEKALAPALDALRDDALQAQTARELSRAQEAVVCWRINLVGSLIMYAGPDAIAYRDALTHVLKELVTLTQPSVAEATQGLVSSLLVCLVQSYPLGEFAPLNNSTNDDNNASSSQAHNWSAALVEGLPSITLPESGIELETFLEASVPGGGAKWPSALRPKWHAATEAELAFARDVLALSLEQPLGRLEEMTRDGSLAAAAGAGTGGRARDALRALLWLIQGAAVGASTCLPALLHLDSTEYTGDGHENDTDVAGADTSTSLVPDLPLTLIGELGATVGDESLRRRGAAAILGALTALRDAGADADPDTVCLLLSVAESFFAAGSLEHADSLDHSTSWAADERWAAERALAGRLLPASACIARRWTRRRPRWLAVEKTYVSLRWRASQAVYRATGTTREPRIALEQIPPLYFDYVRALVHHTLHGYVGNRVLAVYNLERALKAYPVLAEGASAPLLRAMAGLDPENDDADMDIARGHEEGKQVPQYLWRGATAGALPALRAAAADAARRVAARGPLPQGEAEEALAVGMARLLSSGRSFWRLASGPDWAPLRALVAALLASAVHAGAGAQAELLGAAVTLGFRYVKPVKEDDQAAAAIVRDLVRSCLPAVGEKAGNDDGTTAETLAQLPWRYTLLSASLLGMFYESAPADDAGAAASLLLRLLASDLLLLRQVAVAALLKGLLPVWKGAAYGCGAGAEADGGGIVAAISNGGVLVNNNPQREAYQVVLGDSHPGDNESLLLLGTTDSPPTAAVANAVRDTLHQGGVPLVRLIFQHLASNHTQLAGSGADAEGGASSAPLIGSTDEVIVRLVSSSLLRFAVWPCGRENVSVQQDGTFKADQAALVQALTCLCPGLVMDALREPLCATLESTAQDVDRQGTSAAVEALAGLLASGKVFERMNNSGDDGGCKKDPMDVEGTQDVGGEPKKDPHGVTTIPTAWESWVRPLLRTSLRRAPLDLVPLWGLGMLRYATYELAASGRLAELEQICELVAEPVHEDVTRSANASSRTTTEDEQGGVTRGEKLTPSKLAPKPYHKGLPLAPSASSPHLVAAAAATSSTSSSASSSSAHYRRLSYLNHVLTEAVTILGNREQPRFLAELWERLLLEAPGYPSLPGQMVRAVSARLAALLTSNVMDRISLTRRDDVDESSYVFLPAASGVQHPRASLARQEQLARQCLATLTESFDHSVAVLAEEGGRFRRSSSSADIIVAAESTGGEQGDVIGGTRRLAASHGSDDEMNVRLGRQQSRPEPSHERAVVMDTGHGLQSREAMQSEAGSGSVADDGDHQQRLAPSSPSIGEEDLALEPDPSPGSAVLMHLDIDALEAHSPEPIQSRRRSFLETGASTSQPAQAAVSTVAYSVEFMAQALQRGMGTALRRELVRLLPGLLRIQRLIPSELQSVCLAARRALTLLKYLPLAGDSGAVCETLCTLREACRSDIWTERAAALVYLQYFWFRHVLVLEAEGGTKALVDVVVERLADSKLEIRDLAAATLSGLIKGLSSHDAATLRASFLSDAERLLPVKRRRPRAGIPPTGGAATTDATTPATVARRHAAVQGLRAFVLSAPYDVPDWLPEVLMALVRVAGEPGPVKTTVTKTLAEFRRTHEEAGLAEARNRLTAEQWESIRDVANPAPYFV